ncbi:hypothetical protein PanWU01x14_333490 [Parasponia andersonii]|uniref:Uncharacterized protein n=1 Tax=Parasponia andersonii TaxID=3476 RepID=A0A2P5AGY2_PARAD|nr:hypothetical protein PanWU01x14_333490 [Parasponia andersonii]
MAGVRLETKLWEKLLKRECRTLEDFYRRVGRHLRVESSRENHHKTKKEGEKDTTKDATRITNNNNKKLKKRKNEQSAEK